MIAYAFTPRDTCRPACGPSIEPSDVPDAPSYEDCREHMSARFRDGSRETEDWLAANAERLLASILEEYHSWATPDDVLAVVASAARQFWIDHGDVVRDAVQAERDRDNADAAAEAMIERAS